MEIDMELLRRVWDARAAFAAWTEGDASAGNTVGATVATAGAWAEKHLPGAVPALDRLSASVAASDGTRPPPEELDSVLHALEELVLAPGEGAAMATFEASVDVLEPQTGAASPVAVTESFMVEGEGLLDPVCAHLMAMDPENLAAFRQLADLADTALGTDLPEPVRIHLLEAAESLRPVAQAKRSTKAKRSAVVQRVSDLLEEAAAALELAELNASRADAPVAKAAEPVPGPDPASPPAPAGQDIPHIPDSDPLPEGADGSLIGDFVTESFEYMAQAEQALLELEARPKDDEALNVVFRAFHTMKGVAGFLELGRISDLAHNAETLFSKVRDGHVAFSSAVADLALRSVDQFKALLNAVTEGLDSGHVAVPAGYAALLATLSAPDLAERINAGETVEAAQPPATDDAPSGESIQGKRHAAKSSEASVRIRTDRLDKLVDMVGELVIAQSMIAQDPGVLADRAGLARKVDQAAKILRELQDLSTSLRMVPLHPAIRKVSRVVRDLSRKIDKPVRLVTQGEDTEIDRTMVDVLADPLVHMVRNSMDHGIESREERLAAGKPELGTIRIAARQQGGSVVITVTDDGRGLNRESILTKARERGLLDSDRGMSDPEVFGLIFQAGFSTAEKVTEVSGRGVGMDVVRRNVESLRGRVTIESTLGKGSVFSIHLPLTLAITDGMVVRVGAERYIIPSVKIIMSVAPEPGMISTVSGKGEMVRLQGQLLPILRLGRYWNVSGAEQDLTKGLLVIVGNGVRRAALLVDELVTQQQFVVKPLTGIVSKTPGISGGAIMGSGDVGLILDPEAVIDAALNSPAAA